MSSDASPPAVVGEEEAGSLPATSTSPEVAEPAAEQAKASVDEPEPSAETAAASAAAASAENAEMIEPAARPQEQTSEPKPDEAAPPSSQVATVREIALLLDHLASEDIQTRADALKQCCLIANALGPERTRNEFIPFLSELIDDDEEVLYSMIDQLTKMKDFVGGVEFLYHLFPPFEQLCVVEEHSIRRSAVKALSNVISQLPEADCEKHALPLCRRLAASDWHTARMSSPLLCLSTYRRVCHHSREQLRDWLHALVRDTMPMVRRSLVSALGGAIDAFEKEHLVDKGIIMDMFRQLSGDTQDSVRLLCVEGFSKFAGILDPEESQAAMQTMIRQACLDSSWRVRYIAAENFSALCEMCGKEATCTTMLDIFTTKLLKDQEPEVRAVAAQQVAKVGAIITPELVKSKLVPAIQPIVHDSNNHVRSALASVVVKLFGYVSEAEILSVVLPTVLQIMRDTFPAVRLHILRSLSEAEEYINPEKIRDSIFPVIVDLAIAVDWRVRKKTIDLIPKLSSQLGIAFFNKKLLKVTVAWLQDQVAAVRKYAALRLADIAEKFGDEWIRTLLLSAVRTAYESTRLYLHRMSLLDALAAIAPKTTTPECQSAIVQMLTEVVKDKIPNVRMKVAQTICSMRAKDKIPVQDISRVHSLLRQLAKETDPDIIYYANKALRQWDNQIES